MNRVMIYRLFRQKESKNIHTKLLRESIPSFKSTFTKPANDGLYTSVRKEELFNQTRKIKET